MENPKRGEMKLDLGDKSYSVKITMDVLMRIEAATGKGILKLAQELQAAETSATEIVTILTPVLRTTGEDIREKEVQKIVWEASLAEALRCVAEIVAFAISGDNEAGNELKAVNG